MLKSPRLLTFTHIIFLALLTDCARVWSGERQSQNDRDALIQVDKDIDVNHTLNWYTPSAISSVENNPGDGGDWDWVTWEKGRVVRIALTKLKYGRSPEDDTMLIGYSSAFRRLVALQSVEVPRNSIDIRSFEPMRQLRILDLAFSEILDITCLQNHVYLRELILAGNNLTNISIIGNLRSLGKLNLYGNKITDIEPLGPLTDLWEIDLSRNMITDISVLNNLPSLWHIKLSGNQISSIP